MEVVASLSQGRTATAQCGSFTHKSAPVIFEPPCISYSGWNIQFLYKTVHMIYAACHTKIVFYTALKILI